MIREEEQEGQEEGYGSPAGFRVCHKVREAEAAQRRNLLIRRSERPHARGLSSTPKDDQMILDRIERMLRWVVEKRISLACRLLDHIEYKWSFEWPHDPMHTRLYLTKKEELERLIKRLEWRLER
jgi:hypothetical protein